MLGNGHTLLLLGHQYRVLSQIGHEFPSLGLHCCCHYLQYTTGFKVLWWLMLPLVVKAVTCSLVLGLCGPSSVLYRPYPSGPHRWGLSLFLFLLPVEGSVCPVFVVILGWGFLPFAQHQISVWSVIVGPQAQDGFFPIGIEVFAYLLILATVCQCPGRERGCRPFSSGLKPLILRRKGSGQSGGALQMFLAMANYLLTPVPLRGTLWSFAVKPKLSHGILWRLVEKSLQVSAYSCCVQGTQLGN